MWERSCSTGEARNEIEGFGQAFAGASAMVHAQPVGVRGAAASLDARNSVAPNLNPRCAERPTPPEQQSDLVGVRVEAGLLL